ncbi:MAG: glycoside hydrolase family 2 TIM barrel-domain containing protein [Verrucomicrobiota bacterium]
MKTLFVAGLIALASAGYARADKYQVANASAAGKRQVISLDGAWQIAEGSLSNVPMRFDRTVTVPGLVDLATPPFVEPGPKVANRKQVPQKDLRRDAFWYRRTFTMTAPIPAMATLRVGKAMFGTRLILNGKLLGDHAPCFTPGFFEAKDALKTGENELLIRVGADRDAVTAAVPSGFDFEKDRYIPGIFDSVELILCGTPNIVNVQVAPDLTNQQAKVRVWLKTVTDGEVTVEVRAAKSRKVVSKCTARLTASAEQMVDLVMPMAGCRWWSPEDPFLYELTARTAGDEFTTRFGMREFKLDPATGRAMLNGKPYFMRGSNITLYRFFEDSERGVLPWSEAWVRKLHQRVKDMHWNSLRYCIGFPPEFWYRIADEEGVLIQDEFPIWFGGTKWSALSKELKTDELAKEYAEWMRERWNHPCVVVWDANNETVCAETGPAIQSVRGLDLSNRPWDDSYNYPQDPGDVYESHPYHFSNPKFKLAGLATANPVPAGNVFTNDGKHAVIINEYGWLWLNRDGTPTTLTSNLYLNLLGANSTTEQRRNLYARYTAAETEFWRSHRQVAAVLHFTALGYSRADGQTSDHWKEKGVAKLEWEPEFYRYVRDSFAPVGLMVDYFAEKAGVGTDVKITVVAINDLYEAWKGPVTLRLKNGKRIISKWQLPCRIEALGRTNLVFDVKLPEQAGNCTIEAELRGADGHPVRSVREVIIEKTKISAPAK